MHGSAQDRLTNLQVTPPPDTWEQIASQLPVGEDVQEMRLSHKLYNYETPPPAEAWQFISKELAPEAPARIIPFRRIGVAIAAAAAVIAITWIAFNYNSNPPQTTPATTAASLPAAVTPSNTQKPALALAAAISGTRKSLGASATTSPGTVANAVTTAYYDTDEPANIDYAGLTVRPAEVTNKVTEVDAPPIRDSNGNIVLDQQLLTNGDHNYITVTGPNGDQTRISSRFFRMLSNLSNDGEPGSSLEDIIWKNRFHEWRNKLMQRVSFIPSATNFLDIAELNSILQENQ
ncbi:MAG: hypothetical protein QM731_00745 [Chitinophagaceae bacterium]